MRQDRNGDKGFILTVTREELNDIVADLRQLEGQYHNCRPGSVALLLNAELVRRTQEVSANQ